MASSTYGLHPRPGDAYSVEFDQYPRGLRRSPGDGWVTIHCGEIMIVLDDVTPQTLRSLATAFDQLAMNAEVGLHGVPEEATPSTVDLGAPVG